MNENMGKLFSLIIALIFFVLASSFVLNLDYKLRGIVSNREKMEYLPSELSLKYSGVAKENNNNKTKNKMLVANFFLSKSRSETEDVIIKVFGETVNLNVKDEKESEIVDTKNDVLSSRYLKDLIAEEKDFDLAFIYQDLELEKIQVIEE